VTSQGIHEQSQHINAKLMLRPIINSTSGCMRSISARHLRHLKQVDQPFLLPKETNKTALQRSLPNPFQPPHIPLSLRQHVDQVRPTHHPTLPLSLTTLQSPHPNGQRNRTRHRIRLQSLANKGARRREGGHPTRAAATDLRRKADVSHIIP
jgi:hypothetical protein